METAIIIPARLNSKRLPKKMLLDATGKTLIRHTWENLVRLTSTDVGLFIATDSIEIRDEARRFGAEVIMTPECSSGTLRVAHANQEIKAKYVVNVQGDYPTVSKLSINKLIEKTQKGYDRIISLFYTIDRKNYPNLDFDKLITNQNKVKVALTTDNFGLYFSRSPIPFRAEKYNIHVGVYGYMASNLERIITLSSAPQFKSESLEQLVWLDKGIPVQLIETRQTEGIDSPRDYEFFRQRFIDR